MERARGHDRCGARRRGRRVGAARGRGPGSAARGLPSRPALRGQDRPDAGDRAPGGGPRLAGQPDGTSAQRRVGRRPHAGRSAPRQHQPRHRVPRLPGRYGLHRRPARHGGASPAAAGGRRAAAAAAGGVAARARPGRSAGRAGGGRCADAPRGNRTAAAHRLAHRRRLGISVRTVHKHVENIYRKLGTRDRLGTVLRAQRLGLVPAPGPP
ncbi:response regulator transcription factor [Streptomyces sp. NPDC001130]